MTKKHFAVTLVVLLLTCLLAIRPAPGGDKEMARVNQQQGCYLFVDSKPTADYTFLGTVKTSAVHLGSSQYQGVRDLLIKKIKNDYPDADGIIFNFESGGNDHADAIKFK